MCNQYEVSSEGRRGALFALNTCDMIKDRQAISLWTGVGGRIWNLISFFDTFSAIMWLSRD